MSTSLYDLLPPNATQLERDLSRATSSLVRLEQPVPTIRTAKRLDIPDSVIPWLVYEYGLGELLPFVTDQRQLVADGVLWQRIRGTKEAVRVALGWIGIEGTIEEPEGGTDRWAEFMLGLAAPTVGDEIIDRIVGVARVSSPVRSRLQRIYAVYDVRQLVWDDGFWDDGIWDDHSGVRLQPDWPQISYGQRIAALLNGQLTASVVAGVQEEMAVWLRIGLGFMWDESFWNDEDTTLVHQGVITETLGFSARYEGQVWGAFGWTEKTWQEINVVVSGSVTTTTSGGGGGNTAPDPSKVGITVLSGSTLAASESLIMGHVFSLSTGKTVNKIACRFPTGKVGLFKLGAVSWEYVGQYAFVSSPSSPYATQGGWYWQDITPINLPAGSYIIAVPVAAGTQVLYKLATNAIQTASGLTYVEPRRTKDFIPDPFGDVWNDIFCTFTADPDFSANDPCVNQFVSVSVDNVGYITATVAFE